VQAQWPTPSGAGAVPSQEELVAFLAEAAELNSLDPRHRPLPAVLDTDFIRTGLHAQLSQGVPPRSVQSAQDGALRLFMEYDTLLETDEKLPRFADQFGVSVPELRRMLNEDWLPHIDVVKLPAGLRELDPRALRVRLGDVDDFPAAALASLLSPCLLLTHNYKHFSALGVRTRMQGVDGVMAVLAINVGEVQLQAVIFIPSLPFRVVGAAMEWATEKIGPWAWVILGVGVAGGTYWYSKQPPERREQISKAAGDIATRVMQDYSKAADGVYQARLQLRACMVPKPEHRTPTSAILRELALSPESLSAAQLAELLDPSVRPSVADIREVLRVNDNAVFNQVRRGGFVLGSHYQLRDWRPSRAGGGPTSTRIRGVEASHEVRGINLEYAVDWLDPSMRRDVFRSNSRKAGRELRRVARSIRT
jgi:hypothetical protein